MRCRFSTTFVVTFFIICLFLILIFAHDVAGMNKTIYETSDYSTLVIYFGNQRRIPVTIALYGNAITPLVRQNVATMQKYISTQYAANLVFVYMALPSQGNNPCYTRTDPTSQQVIRGDVPATAWDGLLLVVCDGAPSIVFDSIQGVSTTWTLSPLFPGSPDASIVGAALCDPSKNTNSMLVISSAASQGFAQFNTAWSSNDISNAANFVQKYAKKFYALDNGNFDQLLSFVTMPYNSTCFPLLCTPICGDGIIEPQDISALAICSKWFPDYSTSILLPDEQCDYINVLDPAWNPYYASTGSSSSQIVDASVQYPRRCQQCQLNNDYSPIYQWEGVVYYNALNESVCKTVCGSQTVSATAMGCFDPFGNPVSASECFTNIGITPSIATYECDGSDTSACGDPADVSFSWLCRSGDANYGYPKLPWQDCFNPTSSTWSTFTAYSNSSGSMQFALPCSEQGAPIYSNRLIHCGIASQPSLVFPDSLCLDTKPAEYQLMENPSPCTYIGCANLPAGVLPTDFGVGNSSLQYTQCVTNGELDSFDLSDIPFRSCNATYYRDIQCIAMTNFDFSTKPSSMSRCNATYTTAESTQFLIDGNSINETRCEFQWGCTTDSSDGSSPQQCDAASRCDCSTSSLAQNPRCWAYYFSAGWTVQDDAWCQDNLSTDDTKPADFFSCIAHNQDVMSCYVPRCSLTSNVASSDYTVGQLVDCAAFNTTDVCSIDDDDETCGQGTFSSENVAVQCVLRNDLSTFAPSGATCYQPSCFVPCEYAWQCTLTPTSPDICSIGNDNDDNASTGCRDLVNTYGWDASLTVTPSISACFTDLPPGLTQGYCGQVNYTRDAQCYQRQGTSWELQSDSSLCSFDSTQMDTPTTPGNFSDISGCHLLCYDNLLPFGHNYLGNCEENIPIDSATCSEYCAPGTYQIAAKCQGGTDWDVVDLSACSTKATYSQFSKNGITNPNETFTYPIACFNLSYSNDRSHLDLVLNYLSFDAYAHQLSQLTQLSSTCSFRAQCQFAYTDPSTVLSLASVKTLSGNSFFAGEYSLDNCLADLDCTNTEICGTVQRDVMCQYTTADGVAHNFADWSDALNTLKTTKVDLSQACQEQIAINSCSVTSASHCYTPACAFSDQSMTPAQVFDFISFSDDNAPTDSSAYSVDNCNAAAQTSYCNDIEQCDELTLPIFRMCLNRTSNAKFSDPFSFYCTTSTHYSCSALQTCEWGSQVCGWRSTDTQNTYPNTLSTSACQAALASSSSPYNCDDAAPLCGKAELFTQCNVIDPNNSSHVLVATAERCQNIPTFASHFEPISSIQCNNYDKCSSWVCGTTQNSYTNQTVTSLNSVSQAQCGLTLNASLCNSCSQDAVYRTVGCLVTPQSAFSTNSTQFLTSVTTECGTSTQAPFSSLSCPNLACTPDLQCQSDSTEFTVAGCSLPQTFQCPAISSTTNGTEFDYQFPVRCFTTGNDSILPLSSCQTQIQKLENSITFFELDTECSYIDNSSICSDNLQVPIDFSVTSSTWNYNQTSGQHYVSSPSATSTYPALDLVTRYGTNCKSIVTLRDVVFYTYIPGGSYPTAVTATSQLIPGQSIAISWQYSGPRNDNRPIIFYLIPTGNNIGEDQVTPLPQILTMSFTSIGKRLELTIPSTITPGSYALLGLIDKRTFWFYSVNSSPILFTISAATSSSSSSSSSSSTASLASSSCSTYDCGNGYCLINNTTNKPYCKCLPGFSGTHCLFNSRCINTPSDNCYNHGTPIPTFIDTFSLIGAPSTALNCTQCHCDNFYSQDDNCKTCSLQCGTQGSPLSDCSGCQCSNDFVSGNSCECQLLTTTLTYAQPPLILQSIYNKIKSKKYSTATAFESSLSLSTYQTQQLAAWKALLINDFAHDVNIPISQVSVYNYGSSGKRFHVVLGITVCQPFASTLTNTTIASSYGYKASNASSLDSFFGTLPSSTAQQVLADQHTALMANYIANFTTTFNALASSIASNAPTVAQSGSTFEYTTLLSRWKTQLTYTVQSQPLMFSSQQSFNSRLLSQQQADAAVDLTTAAASIDSSPYSSSSQFIPTAAGSAGVETAALSSSSFEYSQSLLATGPSQDLSGGFQSIQTLSSPATCIASGKSSKSCSPSALSSTSPKSAGHTSSFPAGAIGGIVAGVIVILIIIAVIILCCTWIHQCWCFVGSKDRIQARRKERRRQRRLERGASGKSDSNSSNNFTSTTAKSGTTNTINVLDNNNSVLNRKSIMEDLGDEDDERDYYASTLNVDSYENDPSTPINRRASINIGGMRRVSDTTLPPNWSKVILDGREIYINETTLISSTTHPNDIQSHEPSCTTASTESTENYSSGW